MSPLYFSSIKFSHKSSVFLKVLPVFIHICITLPFANIPYSCIFSNYCQALVRKVSLPGMLKTIWVDPGTLHAIFGTIMDCPKKLGWAETLRIPGHSTPFWDVTGLPKKIGLGRNAPDLWADAGLHRNEERPKVEAPNQKCPKVK